MSLNKRNLYIVLIFTMTAVLHAAAADDTRARLVKAAAVLGKLTGSSGQGIRPEQIATADCVAVIPGFKKGAVVVGVAFGRGFISCRNGDNWSAPGAVMLKIDDRPMDLFRPGDVVGEMALVGNTVRCGMAKAITTTQLVVIDSQRFDTLLQAASEADVAAILRAFHRAFLLAACVAAAAAYIASRMPDSALWERQGIS